MAVLRRRGKQPALDAVGVGDRAHTLGDDEHRAVVHVLAQGLAQRGVQQRAWLFSGDVESNLLYRDAGAGEQDLDNALSIAQAGAFIDQTDASSTSRTRRQHSSARGSIAMTICAAMR